MSTVLTIKISGHGAGTNAPTADDWLDQIRDYIEILRGVERAIAADGQSAIEWRVVNARKNSPLAVEIEASPKQYAVDIGRRVCAVVLRTAEGLETLKNSPERPPYFTDDILVRVKRTFERVTNGLDLSEIEFGGEWSPFLLTQAGARSAANNAAIAMTPIEGPYKELAAVEGQFHSVELDGYGHSLLWIRHRLTGDVVKCVLHGAALRIIEDQQIREVFRGYRLLVEGIVHYKSLGRISQIQANDVKFYPSAQDLPAIDDLLDSDFTGGLRSEDYLEKLRNGYHA